MYNSCSEAVTGRLCASIFVLSCTVRSRLFNNHAYQCASSQTTSITSWKSTRPSRFFSCTLKNMGRPGYEARFGVVYRGSYHHVDVAVKVLNKVVSRVLLLYILSRTMWSWIIERDWGHKEMPARCFVVYRSSYVEQVVVLYIYCFTWLLLCTCFHW